jgi:hypothetical protein
MSESPKSDLIVDCARYLALTLDEIRSIAATAPRRYYVWQLEKRSGGKRTVCHPAVELKAIQNYFLRRVLYILPIHANATAYVKGSSIKRNAQAHAGSRVLLKVDFSNFFNSLKVQNWADYASDHFPHWTDEEVAFSSRILFWGEKSYVPVCLAIGAPTSPLISNALMFEVDERLSRYAATSGLIYTRYADDITFSSRGKLDRAKTINEVKKALSAARYSKVRINNKKTALISNRFAKRVTGLIVTPDHKVSLGRDRKRLISAMVHHFTVGRLDVNSLPKLRGLLAFAQDVEPSFVFRLREKYGGDIVAGLLGWNPGDALE